MKEVEHLLSLNRKKVSLALAYKMGKPSPPRADVKGKTLVDPSKLKLVIIGPSHGDGSKDLDRARKSFK